MHRTKKYNQCQKQNKKKMNRIKWTQHIVRQRTYRFRYFKCMRFRPKGTILFVYISFFQKICWWHFAIESNEIEESMFKCHWVSGSSNKGNSLFDWMHCKGPTILETLDGLHFILVFFYSFNASSSPFFIDAKHSNTSIGKVLHVTKLLRCN